jgi:hypothetical protein
MVFCKLVDGHFLSTLFASDNFGRGENSEEGRVFSFCLVAGSKRGGGGGVFGSALVVLLTFCLSDFCQLSFQLGNFIDVLCVIQFLFFTLLMFQLNFFGPRQGRWRWSVFF